MCPYSIYTSIIYTVVILVFKTLFPLRIITDQGVPMILKSRSVRSKFAIDAAQVLEESQAHHSKKRMAKLATYAECETSYSIL